MGPPGPKPTITLADTLDVFESVAEPGTPLTATEVAEHVGCARRTAHRKLEQLAARGDLRTKKVGSRSRIWWWPPLGPNHGSPERDDRGGQLRRERDFGERTERERALEEPELRYRTLIEHFPNGLVTLFDADLRFTLVEGQAFEELDIAPANLTGHVLHEVFPAETGEHLEPAFRAALDGESVSVEVTYEGRHWVVYVAPVRDGNGEVYGGMTLAQDVTERVERERQLREERDRFSTLFEVIPEAVVHVRFDEGGEPIVRNVNSAFEAVFGYEAQSIIDEPLNEYVVPPAYETEADRIDRTAVGLEPIDGEVRRQTVEGERDFLFRGIPFERADGTVEAIGVYVDITERVERERALEESERRYRTLIDHFPNGAVGLVNEDLRYTLVGGDFDGVEHSPHDFEGKTPVEVWEDGLGEVLQSNYRAALDGETNTVEVEHDDHHYRLWTVPVTDENGEVFAAMGMSQNVTEQVEHERRLERTLDLLDKTERIADVGGWEIDPDTLEVFWTEHVFDILGTPLSEEPPLEQAFDVYHEDDRSAIENAVERALEAGEPFDVEVRIRTPADEIRWLRVQGVPEVVDGEAVSLRGAAQDITVRKEHERELRRYETLIEESTDVNAILDPDGTIQYVTPSVEFVLGYAPDELVGENAFEYIHEADRPETKSLFTGLLDGAKEPERAEFRFRDDDNSWVWLEARGQNLRDDPTIDGVIVYTRDVTERKAYEGLLESRARQQAGIAELGREALENPDLDDLFEQAVGLVADILDTDYGKVLELDGDTRQLRLRQGTGWQDGIVGLATVPADDNSQAGYTLRSEGPVVVTDLEREDRFTGPELLRSHDVTSGISTVIGSVDHPWGVLGTHSVRPRSFTDEDVNFVQSVANVLAEAIERQSYEDELEELVDELAASNERLEQFAYVASHDLQEPLRMVSSYLQLLERRHGDSLDEDAKDYIEYAVGGAVRMREMIDDLLAYARVETQAEPLEPTDAEAVVGRVLTNLAVRIEETETTVDVSPLPTVAADGNQLEQVFQNLVSNAIKYRSDSPPRVEIDAERDGSMWQFRVTDNGIGMDPEQTDRVFDVFKRLHSRQEYPGTGIGLAISRRIVERHGGDIWVETAAGEGSTFYFTLPSVESRRAPRDRAGDDGGGER